jgi:hypothetical protein
LAKPMSRPFLRGRSTLIEANPVYGIRMISMQVLVDIAYSLDNQDLRRGGAEYGVL